MRRPRFIAEQARLAKGPLGRLIAFIMARETWNDNSRAIDALHIAPGGHVLDIGCGHGRSLGELARRAAEGRVVGTDPSDLMVSIAVRRTRSLVQSGRVEVVAAQADALPFADGIFDKALCVHVVYFWPELSTSLGEIARVLKPGGRLAILFRTSKNEAVGTFPGEVYRFPALGEMIDTLEVVGFSVEMTDDPAERERTEPVLVVGTKR